MNSLQTRKPARPAAPSDPEFLARKILDFGRLLCTPTGKPGRPRDNESIQSIQAAEEDLIQCLYDGAPRLLREALDFNNKGTNIDELLLRVVAVASYLELASTTTADVKSVALAASVDGDVCQALRIRQTIFRLCVRRVLVLDDRHGSEFITLGKPLLDFFRGPAAEPLFLSQDEIEKVWTKQEAIERRRRAGIAEGNVPTARWIFDQLDRFVTGQHELKVALAVAGRQILLRREAKRLNRRECLPPKPNVLVIGASGSGKSYACRTLSRILCLPHASVDCSQLTASGYIGDDLAGCLYLLTQSAAGLGVAPADGGLIHLDEPKPFVVVRASISKNHKEARLHLHPELAAALRPYRPAGAAPADLAFPKVPTMDQYRADLQAAGIPYLDAESRQADFHALRHTFGTRLSVAGVAPRLAMELMRHSDLRLTMKIYTDASLLPTASAIEKLPGFNSARD